MLWTEVKRLTTGPKGGNEYRSITVTMEQSATNDNGYPHYRVGATYTMSGKSYARKRTFKGETGEQDAERLFFDLIAKIRQED